MKKKPMNHRELVLHTQTYASAVTWMLENKFLPVEKKCSVCINQIMRLQQFKEIVRWKCNKCDSAKSVFDGTIFFNTKKSLPELLDLVYFWCLDSLQTVTREETNTRSRGTVTSWYRKLQVLASSLMLEQRPPKIGGPMRIVEIDESKFTKRKYNVGRLNNSPWVVGGIDTTTGDTFYVSVLHRDAQTLRTVISENVEVGSIIMTDCWKGYLNLEELGYTHFTVNHTYNFVDPLNGANTQKIENSWSHLKRKIRARSIGCDGDLSLVFGEFLFKRKYKIKCFKVIMQSLEDSLNKI